MTGQSSSTSILFQRKISTTLLACFWVLGIVCGIWGYVSAESTLFPLMRVSVLGTMSIVGLLCISILPFLFSAFVVSISLPFFLYAICFCKAFSYILVSLGILRVYPDAGWLVRCMLLFSSNVGVLLLYCFWLRHLPGCQKSSLAENTLFFIFFLVLGCVDYCIISPFLAHLIFT